MLRRAVSVFLVATIFIIAALGVSYAADKARITSSGETLYYVDSATPAINVSPASLDFGTVQAGNTSTLSVTVTNDGAGSLVIGSVTTPALPYGKTADSCSGQTVPQSGTCSITIRFAPMASGTFNSSFNIPSTDPNTPNFNVTVTGKSDRALISASPNPVDFGSINVGSYADVSLTVQNTGDSNLILNALGSPGSPFSKQSATCVNGGTVLPGGTCTVTLRFSPMAAGPFSGSFIITSNASNSPSLTINLSGTGVFVPTISVTPNPDNFGPQTIGSAVNSVITVRNTGLANLVLGSPALTSPSGPFSIASTACTPGLSIAPGGTCTIIVSFAPTSTGPANGGFTVYSNTGGVTGTATAVNLTGSGVAASPTCSASFSPLTITTGQTSILSWTSANDANGQIPYSCTGNLGSGTFSGASGSQTLSPSATQTCTLTADNGAGTQDTCNTTISVTVPAPTCTAFFSPSSMTAGQTSSLSWTSSNDADGQIAYSCTGNLGSGILSGASGSRSFSPTANQNCTLTVVNSAGGSSTCSGSVTVVPAAICTGSFSPSSITTGQNSTLSWTSSNDADGQIAYSCTGNIGSGTLSGASGSRSFSPTGNQNCTLTVVNSVGGLSTCSGGVTVVPAPTCTASFSPSSMTAGQTSSLSWTSANDANGQIPYSCTGNLGSGTLTTASGSRSFSPTANQSCTLTVANSAGGTNTCVGSVSVVPVATCSASFSPSSITAGQTSSLSWTSANDANGQIPYSCTGNLGSGTLTTASGSRSFSPTASQSCTLTVANSAGGTNTCASSVTAVPAATCSASFSPSSITAGQNSTLSWSSSNDADGKIPYSCTGNLGSGTFNTASGSATTYPATSQTCTLTVRNSLGGTNTCSRAVTVAACGQISVSPTAIDFGIVPVGGSVVRTVTVSNAGGGTLSLNSISSPPSPFSIVAGGTCGASLSPGASCTIRVQAAPTSGGVFTGSFNISNNSQCTSQSSTVQLTSTAINSSGYSSGIWIEYAQSINISDPWKSTWTNAYIAGPWVYSFNSYTSYMINPTSAAPLHRMTNLLGSTLNVYLTTWASSGGVSLPICKWGATYSVCAVNGCIAEGFGYTYAFTLPPNSSCLVSISRLNTRTSVSGRYATDSSDLDTYIEKNGILTIN